MQNNEKNIDKQGGACYINRARALRVYAMKREIARRLCEVTFVEYVRYPEELPGYTIGRLKPCQICLRISHGRDLTG